MVKVKPPTLKREKELWLSGVEFIAGVDEAGRGAWAGPVVVGVVVLPKNHRRIPKVHDSKLLKPEERAKLYEKITERALDFGVGIVGHEVINEIGILEATKLAAKQAMELLTFKPEYILADYLDLTKHVEVPFEPIIDGDQKVYSISCASIVAKVTRDNIMTSLGGEYRNYEFHKHKGYGTKRHQELLKKHGPSDVHRKNYQPIKELMKK